jgi:hypothetical protein
MQIMFRKLKFANGFMYILGFWFFSVWWALTAKCFGINFLGARYMLFVQRLPTLSSKFYTRCELRYPNKKMPSHPKCTAFDFK